MNIEELFAGIGVVIDDKVFARNEQDPDHIITIVDQLENTYHFPLVKYSDLPSSENLAMMGNISFLLLDWEFDTREEILGEGGLDVSIGDRFKDANEKRVIEIVKEVSQKSLVPIFLFSNQARDSILKTLEKAEVDTAKSQIYVESKRVLVGEGQLLAKIGTWVDAHSGVYVAKAWDNTFNKAKNQFFAEMANNTSHWPKALFDAAKVDSTNPGEEITQAISQNVISRMQPIEIIQEQIDKDTATPSKDEVLGIMKGQFFLEKAADASMVGDFYAVKEPGHSEKYYINIRPTCDCVGRAGNDGLMYLLTCTQVTGKKSSELYNLKDGHFNETVGCAIVGPLYKGKIYHFNFKTIEIVKYDDWKDKKVGRILPPIINHITERYSLYVQRQALPRIPKEIIPDMPQREADASLNVGDAVVADKEKKKECCLTSFFKNKKK